MKRLRAQPELVLVPLVFVVGIAAWELGVRWSGVANFLIPTPAEVAMALVRGLASGLFISNFMVTFFEALAGFVLAAVAGIALGAVVAEFRLLERTIYPYLVALQAMPKIAIAPILILWLGFGISSKIAIAAIVAFFPVLVNVATGLNTVEQPKVDLLRVHGASRWQIFKTVRFPNALPFVFAGLDVAIVFSILGAIVGEFVGAQSGLGNLIVQQQVSMDAAGIFAVLVLLSAMGIALHLVMRGLGHHFAFWAHNDGVRGSH